MSDGIQISTDMAKSHFKQKKDFKYGVPPTERQYAAVETIAHKADDIVYELQHGMDHFQSAATATSEAGRKFHFDHAMKHFQNATVHASTLCEHCKNNPHLAAALARLHGQL